VETNIVASYLEKKESQEAVGVKQNASWESHPAEELTVGVASSWSSRVWESFPGGAGIVSPTYGIYCSRYVPSHDRFDKL
jgi:hypothetical protein